MKFISHNKIEIGRELSDLDNFVIEFISILRKHTPYVIVSGYVSILLGRARASEDVDIIIPLMEPGEFGALVEDSIKSGFYCLNEEENEDIYDHIKNNAALRFAKKNTVIPNIELKFSKTEIDEESLSDSITVSIEDEELKISPLELQIAFKEIILKTPKDIEDARHLRNVAKSHLKPELIDRYVRLLHGFYKTK